MSTLQTRFSETQHVGTAFADPPPPLGELETAAAVVIPAPLECTVCYGQGTSQGPAAIIAASYQMDIYDETLDWTPMDIGIATLPALSYEGLSHEEALLRTEQAVAEVVAMGKLPVTLGGEHSLTPACIRAVQRAADYAPLGLITFDAHADMRDSYLGTPLSHACATRRAMETPGVCALELGIRSISAEEMDYIRQEQPPISIVWAHQIRDAQIDALLEQLPERVYVTVDFDAFDPASMPAVGTPEPDGISWHEFMRFFRQITERKRIVGLDFVELAPIAGLNHPDYFAAKLVYRALGLTFARLRNATEAAPQ